MKLIDECFLYGFIDTTYLNGRSCADLATCLCDNGVDLLQFRAKELESDSLFKLAEEIKSVTDRFDVPLVINDHPDITSRIGAAFCHMGQEDLRLEEGIEGSAGRFRGAGGFQLGISTHSPEQATRSIDFGAAYLGVGPVYRTGTKPNAKPVTLDYVRWASNHVTLPWFAIGGISLSNLDAVLDAGARRVCVVSAILNSPDPARACKSFKQRLASFPT